MDQPPPEQPSQSPPPGPPPGGSNVHTWAVVCHVAAFAGFVVPFGNIIGPLIVWLLKRHDDPAIEAHGKESVNFQISMTIYTLIAGVLILAVVGIILLPALVILNVVLVIVAAIKASNGETWRYPVTIRMI